MTCNPGTQQDDIWASYPECGVRSEWPAVLRVWSMNVTCEWSLRETHPNFRRTCKLFFLFFFRKDISYRWTLDFAHVRLKLYPLSSTTPQATHEAVSNWGTVSLLDRKCRQGAGDAEGYTAVGRCLEDRGRLWTDRSKGLNYCIYYTGLSKGPRTQRGPRSGPLKTYMLLCTSHTVWDGKGSDVGVPAPWREQRHGDGAQSESQISSRTTDAERWSTAPANRITGSPIAGWRFAVSFAVKESQASCSLGRDWSRSQKPLCWQWWLLW